MTSRYRVLNAYGNQYGETGYDSLTDAILKAESLLEAGSVFDARKNRYVWRYGHRV